MFTSFRSLLFSIWFFFASFSFLTISTIHTQDTHEDTLMVQYCITYWIFKQNIDQLEWLLSLGLSPNTLLHPTNLPPCPELAAFTEQHLEKILARFQRPAVPAHIPPITLSQSLLQYAVFSCAEKSVGILLTYKASPLLKNPYGYNTFDEIYHLPSPYYEKMIGLLKKHNWYPAYVNHLNKAQLTFRNQIYG